MNKKVSLFLIPTFILLIGTYYVLDAFLFDGVRPQQVQENGFQGSLFAPKEKQTGVGVILLGGGSWGDYWAAEFARAGMTGLSLPYVGREGLPALPEEIPLEYFEKAISWLGKQPTIDPHKIVIAGASRNAELALTIAAHIPAPLAVIAIAPSSVSWSNTVLPYNSDEIKASWTYQGKPIPYIAMKKLSAPTTEEINTLAYWEKGLADSLQIANAVIPVENISGPVLLLSGKDDQVWPAARMSDAIVDRLRTDNPDFPVQSIQYESTGHQICGMPEQTHGTMTISGKEVRYPLGGTVEGNVAAHADLRQKIFSFLQSL
ncbi:MAG: acyl-CoA thioester hydrolase/BAAT C-terminal domain-containing protein [Bacteroidota bacterium]